MSMKYRNIRNGKRLLIGLTLALLSMGPLPAADAAEDKKIGITMIVDVPQLIEAKEGLMSALSERGYKEGQNLEVDFQSANGSMPTQLQIAKRFAGRDLDAIIAVTTPTAQVIAGNITDKPIVFMTVVDPVGAKLISAFEPTGGNITGVSDAPPIGMQLSLFKEMLPDLKQLGFVYNPGLASSKAVLEGFRKEGAKLGIEIVPSGAPTTNEIIPATRKLIGQVQGIYVPADTTVLAALEAVVKVGEDADIPIFAHEPRGVERGALAAVGLNYFELGHIAGVMVADVFDGKEVGEIKPVIAYEVLTKFLLAVNMKAAAAHSITVPNTILERATLIIE